MNKLLVILYVLLVISHCTGCATRTYQPEGRLVGSMKAYRTPTGSWIIVSDQNGDRFEFDVNIHRVVLRRRRND